jgi:hypothetical protein
MSEQKIRADLLEHLTRVEAEIDREIQEERGGPRNFYRLSLLTGERARVRRHIERLDRDGDDAA